LLLAALKKSAIERCPCVLRCNGSVDGSEMWASRGGAQVNVLHFVMIKPSHYDDDGYPIQWIRSAIPPILWPA
jgi:hypothetical protein